MAYERKQFRHTIRFILGLVQGEGFGVNTPAAIELLMGTAAAESALGTYLYQFNNGPAMGPFQMERKTHIWLWDYLQRRPRIATYIQKVCPYPNDYKLRFDLGYQIVMTRLKYWTIPESLPDPKDIEAMARYWKKYYNTSEGKGTIGSFVNCYEIYCA